jgi:hypothetical protein
MRHGGYLFHWPVTVEMPRTIANGHGQTVADEFGVVTRGCEILR